MTKELQGKMFTYGFSTKGKEGRGIGLALVHQIVSAHHGKLKVESEVGLGTEMIIEARKEGEMND